MRDLRLRAATAALALPTFAMSACGQSQPSPADAGALVGVDAEGRVQTSRDGGRTWQAVAFAAVEDGTVYESHNGGGDFTVAFRPVGT